MFGNTYEEYIACQGRKRFFLYKNLGDNHRHREQSERRPKSRLIKEFQELQPARKTSETGIEGWKMIMQLVIRVTGIVLSHQFPII